MSQTRVCDTSQPGRLTHRLIHMDSSGVGQKLVRQETLSAFGNEHGGARGQQRPGPRRPLEERPEYRGTVLSLGSVAVDALLAIGREEAVIDPGESIFPVELKIACLFMLYGRWKESSPEAFMDGNRVTAIKFRWEPEIQENEGFETSGFLSQIFSHYNSELTMEGQQVGQLYAPCVV